MVEDYVPDRLEFDLASPTGRIAQDRAGRRSPSTAAISTARRPPISTLEGEVVISAAKERPGFAGYQFGLDRRGRSTTDAPAAGGPAADRRQGQGDASPSALDKMPAATRPLEAQVIVRLAESGGRAVERKLTLPVTPRGRHDRREAAVLRQARSARARRRASTSSWSRPTARRSPRSGLRYELLQDRDAAISGTAATATGTTSRSSRPAAIADGRLDVAADRPAASRAGAVGPLSARSLDRRAGRADHVDRVRRRLLRRSHAPTRRTCSEIALDKPEYRPGETMTVAVTARTAGRVTLNVVGDRLITTDDPGRAGRAPRASALAVGQDWGSGAYVVATLRRPLDAARSRMPGPRHRRAMVLGRPQGARTLALDMKLPHADAAEHDAARADQGRRAQCRAKRRASSSPRSTSASSISPTTSRRRRTTIISASAGCPPRSATSTAS